MPTTEIAILPLAAGSVPGDPDNASAPIVKDSLTTISQQDGVGEIWFGMQVERPDVLQMVINWDKVESHHKFQAKDLYGTMLKKFEPIMPGKPNLYHVDFQPAGAFEKLVSAPVTEFFTVYYDGDVPDGALERVGKFMGIVKDNAENCLGPAYGKTHEQLEGKGVKGYCIQGAIGWQSVDAHMAYRETQAFKDSRPLLTEGMAGIDMHHVVMMQSLS